MTCRLPWWMSIDAVREWIRLDTTSDDDEEPGGGDTAVSSRPGAAAALAEVKHEARSPVHDSEPSSPEGEGKHPCEGEEQGDDEAGAGGEVGEYSLEEGSDGESEAEAEAAAGILLQRRTAPRGARLSPFGCPKRPRVRRRRVCHPGCHVASLDF